MVDIVRVADGARGDVDPRIAPIELAIVGPKRRVTTTTSMTLSVDHPLSETGDFDVVVVPARSFHSIDAALKPLPYDMVGAGISTRYTPPGTIPSAR